MQLLESYLTKEGWKNDWHETVDPLVDSGRSVRTHKICSHALAVINGIVLGSIISDAPPMDHLGLMTATGVAGVMFTNAVLYLSAGNRRYRLEHPELTPQPIGYAGFQSLTAADAARPNPEWIEDQIKRETTRYGYN